MYSSDLYSMVVYGSYTIESPSNRTGHRSKYIRSRNTNVQLTLWQVGLPEQVLTSTWCAWCTCTYHVVLAHGMLPQHQRQERSATFGVGASVSCDFKQSNKYKLSLMRMSSRYVESLSCWLWLRISQFIF